MSGLVFWTYLSIGVLVFLAPLVFGWFLKDAARLLRDVGRAGRRGDRN